MRRELLVAWMVPAVLGAATACRQSASERAQYAAARVRNQAITRQSELVQRLRSPTEQGRVLYDPPIDLSDTARRRTQRHIPSRADSAPAPREPRLPHATPR